MALEEIKAQISLLLEQMVNQPEDAHEVHENLREKLNERLAREGRTELAQRCFDFLPTRARLDLAGWPEIDIFAH